MRRSAGSRSSGWAPDLGSLSDQHQRLERREPISQRRHGLEVIVEHGDFVAGELRDARQRAKRVEVVVEDRDLH
jgi:predicted phosphodiesterase